MGIEVEEKVVTYCKTTVLTPVECLEMPWKDYLAKQYEAWEAATCLANGIIWQLMCRDEPLWKSGLAHLRPTKEVFGVALDTLAYRLASADGLERYSSKLPSGTVASLSREVARRYAEKRRGVMEHLNDSYPLFKFPLSLPVRASDVTIDIDPKDENGFTVQFPLLRHQKGVIESVTLRFPPIKDDRNTSSTMVNGQRQMPLLEKLRRNILKHGSLIISDERRSVSASQGKELPFKRDRFGYRYVYEPKVGIAVHHEVNNAKGHRGLVFIHTDPNQFLVAQIHRHAKWNMHMEHMLAFCHMPDSVPSPAQIRDMIDEHDGKILRLREDAKANYMGSRVKSASTCSHQARRIKNFINAVVRGQVRKVQQLKFAEVVYFDGDQRYMPHFDWAVLRKKLEDALFAEGIPFHYAEAFIHSDCRKDDGFDYAKIYLKLRSAKAVRTKIDNQHNLRERAEVAV